MPHPMLARLSPNRYSPLAFQLVPGHFQPDEGEEDGDGKHDEIHGATKDSMEKRSLLPRLLWGVAVIDLPLPHHQERWQSGRLRRS